MKIDKNIHKLWHLFLIFLEKKFLDHNKMYGYECMQYIGKYVKRHPEIKEIHVDDAVHAGSSIFLVPHESKDEYWGTTMIFVPQCTDLQNHIFLYDNHLDNLIEELQKIQKKHKEKPRSY